VREQREAAPPVLAAEGVAAGYHGHPVVHDVDLSVSAGEIVAVLGPNGAGKTTTLLALSGDLPLLRGEVALDGKPTRSPLHRRARNGLAFVTEERSVFMKLSVAENLAIGDCDAERALALFPELKPLLKRRAGLLSGGEQQMLTLARALGRDPKLLLVDELSLGLAPMVVTRLMGALADAAAGGVAVVLVEQHVRQALELTDRVCVMSRGRIVLQGAADELTLDEVESAYLHDTGGSPVRAAGGVS
jgi:branched-chain amino acid transport system ATP-binding protein